MRVGIDEAGKDDFPGAIDLVELLAVLLDPGIAQSFFGGTDRDDLARDREDSGVFEDAEVFEVGATARTRLRRPQRQELPDTC